MSTLQERLAEVMRARGWEHADLVRISGQSSSVVSQWRGKSSKIIKRIGRMDAAMRIEAASGYSALWLATGEGPKFIAGERGPNYSPVPAGWHERFAALRPEEREMLIAAVESMLGTFEASHAARSRKHQAAA